MAAPVCHFPSLTPVLLLRDAGLEPLDDFTIPENNEGDPLFINTSHPPRLPVTCPCFDTIALVAPVAVERNRVTTVKVVFG